jgi:hypothetical protein
MALSALFIVLTSLEHQRGIQRLEHSGFQGEQLGYRALS